jgi:pimeloyl-ACP methyl ester carboxylesterase
MKLFPYSIFFSLVFCTCTTSKHSYESVEKNQDFRDAILNENNGDYVLLRNGYTYYEEANSESKEGNIILVHGFSVPSYIWEVTFNTLKEKGYRVVMMDLFGRGNSDNPDLPQTDELRAQQVLDLMDALCIEKSVLAGLSNGGRIISKMAVLDASKIAALFYVSSSSFVDYESQMDKTVSPEEITSFIKTYPTRSAGQLEDFYTPEQFPEWPQKYEKLLSHKGFAKALLSTQKNLTTMDKIHQTIDSLKLPVYAFWGVHDKVVVYSDFDIKLNKLLPNKKEFFIEEAGHLPHMENKKVFEDYFLSSLQEVMSE